MAGLYIHIPFCSSRCVYCGFYSTTGLELRERYVDAICRELEVRGEKVEGEKVSTIYLGGGTPSQLSIQQLERILTTIYIYNKVEGTAEVTIEMNPDDVNLEFAKALFAMGINRVSMGVQTFNDERLRFLHRLHNSSQVPQAVDT